MPTCSVCQNSNTDTQAIFCSKCGVRYSEGKKLPYIGQPKNRGIYRIIFPPQEGEFNCLEAVQDGIRHSAWSEDMVFTGEAKIEFVRSTVTIATHPYGCSTCKSKKGRNYEIVSTSDKGRCEGCGDVNWQLRTN